MSALQTRLQKLECRLRRIQQISGLPGCSFGVIRGEEVVWKVNLGHRDVQKQLPPESNTAYHPNSLTKAFTSAAPADLVREQKTDRESPIVEFIAEFARGHDELDRWLTPMDLLSCVRALLLSIL